MLNPLRALLKRLRRSRADGRRPAAPAGCRDPLSHPDLAKMSLRELADLPFHPALPPGAPHAAPPKGSSLDREDAQM